MIPLAHPLRGWVYMATSICIPDDDVRWTLLFPDIAKEDEYMISIERYDLFSLWSLPCEVTIDVPIFTRVFP